uniref:Uncharacterized protein n=1 Tax=Oryza brachyantha TaxID=4533 RepID=J3M3S8_ORYBR
MASPPLALVSSPTARPPPRRRLLYLKATSRASTSSSSSRVLSHGGAGAATRRPLPQPQPTLVAAPARSQPPPLAAGAVRGDAVMGLAFLLLVLAVVMSSFLSLAILSFPTWRALKRLEIVGHELSKVVAEEVQGTLSSLKLSCLEINDLTSQLKNFRQRLMKVYLNRTSVDARSQTGRPKQVNI